MAGASLFALLDDIATLLDDVAAMSKVAVKKTSGVLGDDLALNAEQVMGIHANREIPVVLKVARGSLVNKAILVPSGLALAIFLPQAITPLLLAGGVFLCFEGVEKILHRDLSSPTNSEPKTPMASVAEDFRAHEEAKIKGAVRTDFILSAEIIVITLGAIEAASLAVKIGVLVSIALLMTVGVYGLVAAIVKMDDLGFYLATKPKKYLQVLGRGLVTLAPQLMRFLSWAGTIAMFLVGGGIVVHRVPWIHHLTTGWTDALLGSLANASSLASSVGATLLPLAWDFVTGVLSGLVVIVMVKIFKIFQRFWQPVKN